MGTDSNETNFTTGNHSMAILFGNGRELDLKELSGPSSASFDFKNDHSNNLPSRHRQGGKLSKVNVI
eukprot:368787-Amphidinium_carterae.1